MRTAFDIFHKKTSFTGMTLLQQIERDVMKLSVEERERLIATVEKTLPAQPHYFTGTEEDCDAELLRRREELLKNPEIGLSWEDVKARLKI